MTSQTLYQGGLRPAAAVPQGSHPGLQIHSIEAPRTDRRLSFLVSANIYCAAAAILVLVSQAAPDVIKKISGPDRIVDFREPPIETHIATAPPAPVLAAMAASRPETIDPVLPQPEVNPDAIPDHLPTSDVRTTGLYPSNLPVSPDGMPHPGLPNGSAQMSNTAGTNAPMEVDFHAVRILQQVQPAYPNLARLSHKEGDVVLIMTINEQGVPTDVQMASGDAIFMNDAIRAARQWRFTPATMNGQPHSARFRLNLLFRFKG